MREYNIPISDNYTPISDWIIIEYRNFGNKVGVPSICFEYTNHLYCLSLKTWRVVTSDGQKVGTIGTYLYESDEYPDLYVQINLCDNRARVFKRKIA